MKTFVPIIKILSLAAAIYLYLPGTLSAQTSLDCGDDVAITLDGYAQAWTPNSTVQNFAGNSPESALNAPDGSGVQLWQAESNVLTLDMTATVPEGEVATLHLSTTPQTSFHGDVLIQSSADGTNFSGDTIYTLTSDSFAAFDYTVPAGGARFIRITPLDNGGQGTAVRVDGLTYSYQYCECAGASNWTDQGSFEEFASCSLQSGDFGSWSTIGANVHIWGTSCPSGWESPVGENSIDLDGNPGVSGGIEQVISGLTPGNTYNLTFYQAFNPASGAASASMRVEIGDFTDTFTSASNATVGGFNQVHVEFTAQSETETLRFVSLTGSNDPNLLNGGGTQGFGVVLDGIRITPQNCSETPPDGEIELTVGPCWRMLSSPVQGLTYAEMLDDTWTQGSAGADYSGGEPNVLTWDVTAQDWAPVSDLNTVIPPGSGFLVGVYDLDEYGNPATGGWPKTLTFPGGPEHSAPLDAPDMNLADGEWALLGNPFQSNVDTQVLTDSSSNLTGAYYVYDGNSGGWVSTAGGFGELTDGAIASGQGFFVQAGGASPSLRFTENSKTINGQFYGKQDERSRFIRLEVTGQSLSNAMWIRFSEAGSAGPGGGDALELMPLSEEYVLAGSRKAGGMLMDIGHFPMPEQETSIPFGIEATRAGSYTIKATDLNIPAGVDFYLKDRHKQQSILLGEGVEYTFTVDQSAKASAASASEACSRGPQKAVTGGDDRFVLTTVAGEAGEELPRQVSLSQNYPNPFNPSTVIRYALPAPSQVRLQVFDLTGRLVATLVEETVQAGVHTVPFDANRLSSGIYLYSLQAGGTTITKKLTLIK